jgi:hypothetical protein
LQFPAERLSQYPVKVDVSLRAQFPFVLFCAKNKNSKSVLSFFSFLFLIPSMSAQYNNTNKEVKNAFLYFIKFEK